MDSPHAALILAEAEGDVPAVRSALEDGEPSIRAAALGSLSRCHDLRTEDLRTGLTDPDARVRCRAIELAIAVREVDLHPYLTDEDDLVVETAAWALGERETVTPTDLAALTKTATDHDVSICREAAVAALGAIGDPAGLPAILAAMSDRAPVRRRAVLALSPFEHPDVDIALNQALEDRDRQVRQAAEDLLGTPQPQPRHGGAE